jgi:hypothetical protein
MLAAFKRLCEGLYLGQQQRSRPGHLSIGPNLALAFDAGEAEVSDLRGNFL